MAFTRNFDAKFNDESQKFEEDRTERAKPRFWLDDVYDKKTDTLTKVEMVEIRVAGEDKNVWAGKVTEDHRRRFPTQYRAFKNNEEMPVNGTALSKLPGMHNQLEQQLKYMGVTSIEELARLTEQACTQVMGGYALRKKAALFIEEHRATASTVSQKDQIIAEQGAMLAKLQEQMAEMSAKMAAKSKGGRPKKDEAQAAA
jgi:hypothetical protein